MATSWTSSSLRLGLVLVLLLFCCCFVVLLVDLLETILFNCAMSPCVTGTAGLSFRFMIVRSICWKIGCSCWLDKTWVISCKKAVGFSTSACASGRDLSKTIAINISPPSSWMSAGRPFCNWSRIATALFSHIVRSHSSTARCIRVAFCGGMCPWPGWPNFLRKGLSGGLAGGRDLSSSAFRHRACS